MGGTCILFQGNCLELEAAVSIVQGVLPALPLASPQGASGLWHRVTQRKGHRAPDNNAVTCECVGRGPGALWLSEIKEEE